jgi:hypothetical protein
MTGINHKIIPDPRISLFQKHLPDTPQVKRLLKKEGKAHVFNDQATMERVIDVIINQGGQTGVNDETDKYERYGLYFTEPIGYIIKIDGSKIPLYYAEIKIIKGENFYHVIPRTHPRKTT